MKKDVKVILLSAMLIQQKHKKFLIGKQKRTLEEMCREFMEAIHQMNLFELKDLAISAAKQAGDFSK